MAQNKKQKSMEETLWDSANKLRGTVESSEYKHVVLGLIFLKFASDKFEERRQELKDEGKERYLEMVEFYTQKNIFFLPKESRWSHIIKNSKQDNIALIIDTALHTTTEGYLKLELKRLERDFPSVAYIPTKSEFRDTEIRDTNEQRFAFVDGNLIN